MSQKVFVDQTWDGTREYAHFDTEGNLVGLAWENDVEAVLEANKRAQCDGTHGYGPSREWRHVASIPPALLMKFAFERCGHSTAALKFINTREGFNEIVMKMIRDPDYRWLRTDI